MESLQSCVEKCSNGSIFEKSRARLLKGCLYVRPANSVNGNKNKRKSFSFYVSELNSDSNSNSKKESKIESNSNSMFPSKSRMYREL